MSSGKNLLRSIKINLFCFYDFLTIPSLDRCFIQILSEARSSECGGRLERSESMKGRWNQKTKLFKACGFIKAQS